MSCLEWEEKISALADEELSAAERRDVLAHIRRCPPCRERGEVLAALKKTLGSALERPSPPEDLCDLILARIPLPEGPEKTLRRPRMRPWSLGLAFAAALIMAASALFWKARAKTALPLDWILAAHNAYAASLPLAQQELALPGFDSSAPPRRGS